jgi:hypothetical protein
VSAFLSTPQAIRRRRAFYAAMEPLVGSDSALEAINLWENTFGSEQPLLRGISQFASLAVRELGWSISASDLSVRFLECLQRSEHTLPPDPIALLTGRSIRDELPPASTRAPTAAALDAPIQRAHRPMPQSVAIRRTLGVLLLRLCDQAGQADPRSQAILIRYVARIAEAELPAGVAADVGSLLNGRSTELTLDYGKGLASQVINAFYVPLAELFGPVSADRIVTQAVRSAEASSEARDFAPRDLL